MKNPIRFFTAALACMVLLAGGCATVPISESVHVAKWKKTAFVSVTGGDFCATRIGTTVFNNNFQELHPEGLALDAKVTEALLPILKEKIPTTEFVSSPGDVGALRATFVKPIKSSYRFEPTEDYLGEIRAMGFDSLILVRSTYADLSSDYNPHWFSGFGILCRDFMSLHTTFAVAAADVVFYDLSAPVAVPSSLRITAEAPLEGIQWRASWDAYAPDQQVRLMRALDDLVAEQLREALYGNLERRLYPKNP